MGINQTDAIRAIDSSKPTSIQICISKNLLD